MEKPRRILLTVAYDGTEYHGFAKLKDDDRTIEGRLEEALTGLLGRRTEITGASRTDSGVHALANAVVFDTDSNIPAENFPDEAFLQVVRNEVPHAHRRYCK